jgi:predicted aspartyl protease
MGSRSRLLSAGWLALLPAAVAADETIPFREAWGWAVVVPVAVAGAGVHEMLLDTGTTSTILEPGLAEELGLRATSAANLLTPAGRRPVALGSVELALGSTTLEDVEVVVAELPAIRSDEPRVRGILGQSALSRLEYTIDHARRRLVVHRPAAARAEEMPEPGALQAQPVAAPRPLVEARLDCGGASVRLVLDSGVEAPVLFEGAHARPELELGASLHAATNAGDAVWREARLRSLCVAGHRAGPLRVVVRPASAPARAEDGLLPSRFFARVRLGAQGTVLAVDPW